MGQEGVSEHLPNPKGKDTVVLPPSLAAVSPLVVAAVLLVARSLCQRFELPRPTAQEILAATGASRSRAYEIAARVEALLPTLVHPIGRPPSDASLPPALSDDAAVTRSMLRFVMTHPGCAHAHAGRQRYSDELRCFVVALREQHADMDWECFAAAVEVPAGTLKAWQSVVHDPVPSSADSMSVDDETPLTETPTTNDPTLPQIETLLAAWKSWHGTFVDFCAHLQREFRLPFGRQLIAHILEAHGVRLPRRRQGRSPDEIALRGAFETFFPGAQWVGDGKVVSVQLGEQRFTFNLELMVDADSAASVGMSVRVTEDSAAVTTAFADGIVTTTKPPIAVLLDNRPSNHTPEVDAALGDTLRIRATPERPQNKAHVEGALGLFSQAVPPIALDTNQPPRALAQQLLSLIACTWARTLNHRPRADRCGRSRVDLYRDAQPTQEQIAHARRALEERFKRQELAHATRQARERPEVRDLLDAHFQRLALLDPERHIRLAIARYPIDAIVSSLAIYESKLRAGSLPEGADARYLLGIVRNVAADIEGQHLAHALLRLRLEARDRTLAALTALRALVCAPDRPLRDVFTDCVDRALEAERSIDRLFWISALADLISPRPQAERDALFLDAARRIRTTFRVPLRERQHATLFLSQQIIPLV